MRIFSSLFFLRQSKGCFSLRPRIFFVVKESLSPLFLHIISSSPFFLCLSGAPVIWILLLPSSLLLFSHSWVRILVTPWAACSTPGFPVLFYFFIEILPIFLQISLIWPTYYLFSSLAICTAIYSIYGVLYFKHYNLPYLKFLSLSFYNVFLV